MKDKTTSIYKNAILNKATDVLQIFIKYIIVIISMLFLGFIFLQSFFGSTFLDFCESSFFIEKPFWSTVLIVLIPILIAIIVKIILQKYSISIVTPNYIFLGIVTVVYTILMIMFVYKTGIPAMDDQELILNAANDLLNNVPDMWDKGAYCYRFPNQNGFVLFVALGLKMFGADNQMVFQYLNIPMLILSSLFLSKTIYLLFNDKKLARYSYIFLLGFFQLNCYVTFVYGTLYGLAASVAGIFLLIKYFKKRNIVNGLVGISLLSIGYGFKSNYLIMIVAACLLLLFDAIVKKSLKSVISLVWGIVFYVVVVTSISSTIYHLTGKKVDEGTPNTAWVAMGLQESYKAPGWWNGYNAKVFADNEYDIPKTKEAIFQNISERVGELKKDKEYTLSFFSKKTASQWNEGTFECFYITNLDRGRLSNPTWTDSVKNLMVDGHSANRAVTTICNYFIVFLWLGIILFLIFDFRKLDAYKLIFAITFIGGFLFHLVWEAKGQYTIIYAYLMIPYMLRGYQLLLRRVCNISLGEKEAKEKRGTIIPVVVIALVVIVIGISNNKVVNETIKLNGDKERYESYMSHQVDDLDDGYYTIIPANDSSVTLAGLIGNDKKYSDKFVVDCSLISLCGKNSNEISEQSLGILEGKIDPGTSVGLSATDRSIFQRWIVKKVKDNTYEIYDEYNLALTYDKKKKTLSIEQYTRDKNQQWVIYSAK